jgi:ABC-type nickel/cobalt efflux system permease component RcnA
VFGLDERIAELTSGDALLMVIAVAVLLGLRHATDPDHLAAVSTLIASEDEAATGRAGVLGLSWGAGHAITLFAFGLPIVLFESYLPAAVQQAAEVAIGVVIMALAVRLLMRWRRGRFHAHSHHHEGIEHRHLHGHEQAHARHDHDVVAHGHDHDPESVLGRSPLQAMGIGLVHGMGGSAGVGVLLVASIPGQATGVVALIVLAVFTAVSMALLSSGFGLALTRGPVARRALAVAPVLGALSLAFGAWYALGALEAVPYPL